MKLTGLVAVVGAGPVSAKLMHFCLDWFAIVEYLAVAVIVVEMEYEPVIAEPRPVHAKVSVHCYPPVSSSR
jgi:hypothetical protein